MDFFFLYCAVEEGRKEMNFFFLLLCIHRYFKQSAATFFGLDESREGELRQRWEDRRRRLAERRCGTLRESSAHLIDVRTAVIDLRVLPSPLSRCSSELWRVRTIFLSFLFLI